MNVYVFAGPNGAGKTTIAKPLFKEARLAFLNADEIASGLSPYNPSSVKLGRVVN